VASFDDIIASGQPATVPLRPILLLIGSCAVYSAAFTGYQCDNELFLRLLSLVGRSSTVSLQRIYNSSVSQWIFAYGRPRQRLEASSYHGCRHQSDSRSSLSLDRPRGIVCHQPALRNYNLSPNTFKRS